MKNLITKIFAAAMIVLSASANAQTSTASADDLGRISLTPYVASNIPSGATSILNNKLNQLTSANNMGSAGYNGRFIITANITTLTKDVVAGAPPMIALTLDVTLFIGDGIEGRKFTSQSITVKGVGQNENKAYIEAIKQINPNNPQIQSFLTNGKNQIITYYNTRCDAIMKEAKMLEAQNKYEEAIMLLTSVPDASSACYTKAMNAVAPLFQKKIDRDCKVKLAAANSVWNANQSWDAANEVSQILMEIDPQSSCFGEVKAFSEKVGKRIKELDTREWNYHYEEQIGLKKDMIKAYRDVGVAYGNGQPNSVTYNVHGWW